MQKIKKATKNKACYWYSPSTDSYVKTVNGIFTEYNFGQRWEHIGTKIVAGTPFSGWESISKKQYGLAKSQIPERKPITVGQLVKDRLRDRGFDGLFSPYSECGCLLDKLAPCESLDIGCIAGYRRDFKEKDQCGCAEEGTEHWHIVPR